MPSVTNNDQDVTRVSWHLLETRRVWLWKYRRNTAKIPGYPTNTVRWHQYGKLPFWNFLSARLCCVAAPSETVICIYWQVMSNKKVVVNRFLHYGQYSLLYISPSGTDKGLFSTWTKCEWVVLNPLSIVIPVSKTVIFTSFSKNVPDHETKHPEFARIRTWQLWHHQRSGTNFDKTDLHNCLLQRRCCQIFIIIRTPPETFAYSLRAECLSIKVTYHKIRKSLNYCRLSYATKYLQAIIAPDLPWCRQNTVAARRLQWHKTIMVTVRPDIPLESRKGRGRSPLNTRSVKEATLLGHFKSVRNPSVNWNWFGRYLAPPWSTKTAAMSMVTRRLDFRMSPKVRYWLQAQGKARFFISFLSYVKGQPPG